MERDRHFAGISRSVQGEDGQSLQHFMSVSPWAGQAVFGKIQEELCGTPALAKGSYLVLDESADEKAGGESMEPVGSTTDIWGKWTCAKWQLFWDM